MSSLYQKLGGEPAISAVVDKFYELMLADEIVNHFFSSTDMSKQRCRQKQFITLVTGGPSNYQGSDMKTAHCKHNILKTHFDITWKHLEEALLHFSVERILIQEVRDIFYSVQEEIVKDNSSVSNAPQPLSFVQDENKKTKIRQGKYPFSGKQDFNGIQKIVEVHGMKLSRDVYMKLHY